MKKKHTIETLGLCALLLLSGCTTKKSDVTATTTTTAPTTTADTTAQVSKVETTTEPTTETSDPPTTSKEADETDNAVISACHNIPLRIADKDGSTISELSVYQNTTLTDHGVLYTRLPKEGDNSTIEYRLFDTDSKEDKKLGEMTGLSYQTAYSYAELNGKFYTLAMTGYLMDNLPDPLFLLEIDLVNGGINKYLISGNGYPYVSLCQAGEKILAFTHDQQKDGLLLDHVLEFDPETKKVQEVLIFKYQDNDRGDTVRSLYSDEKNIYLLRVQVEDKVPSLIIDTYDMSYVKTGEQDITQVFRDSVKTPEDITSVMPVETLDDIFYQVARFFITPEGDLYYCNFNDEVILANLNTGRKYDHGELFRASYGNGTPFFGSILQKIEDPDAGINQIFHLKDGTLNPQTIDLFDDQYYIESMQSTPGGKEGIFLSIQDPEHLNKDYPYLLYICK